MPIIRTDFNEITEPDLQGLIDANVPEGLDIEYKRDPYDRRDPRSARELLKDVTSFANASGGQLIIGMEEENGVASRLAPFPRADADALINRLESLIRDRVEPRITGVRTRAIQIGQDGAMLIVRVPKSWNSPHGFKVDEVYRFCIRNSNGAHNASVEELRVLFSLGADSRQQVKNFRKERIAKITDNAVLVPPISSHRLIVHLVPLSALHQSNQIDLAIDLVDQNAFKCIDDGPQPNFNFDGLLSALIRQGGVCEAYTQVFRSGIVEAVKANIRQDFRGERILHAGSVAKSLIEAVTRYFDGLEALGVQPPFVLMVSLQQLGGARLALPGFENRLAEIYPLPGGGPLLLPEVLIDEYGAHEDYHRAMRPIFDTLWNAAGFARCTFYTDDGSLEVPN